MFREGESNHSNSNPEGMNLTPEASDNAAQTETRTEQRKRPGILETLKEQARKISAALALAYALSGTGGLASENMGKKSGDKPAASSRLEKEKTDMDDASRERICADIEKYLSEPGEDNAINAYNLDKGSYDSGHGSIVVGPKKKDYTKFLENPGKNHARAWEVKNSDCLLLQHRVDEMEKAAASSDKGALDQAKTKTWNVIHGFGHEMEGYHITLDKIKENKGEKVGNNIVKMANGNFAVKLADGDYFAFEHFRMEELPGNKAGDIYKDIAQLKNEEKVFGELSYPLMQREKEADKRFVDRSDKVLKARAYLFSLMSQQMEHSLGAKFTLQDALKELDSHNNASELVTARAGAIKDILHDESVNDLDGKAEKMSALAKVLMDGLDVVKTIEQHDTGEDTTSAYGKIIEHDKIFQQSITK